MNLMKERKMMGKGTALFLSVLLAAKVPCHAQELRQVHPQQECGAILPGVPYGAPLRLTEGGKELKSCAKKLRRSSKDEAGGEGALEAELNRILEETVADALEEQRQSFLKQKSFWRRTALTEGLIILTGIFSGVMVYRMTR